MNFTAQDVKVLRERTGCGMMDCKKALSETNGDMDKAIDYLREKGLAKAAKKAGRIAAEGIVDAYVDGNVGVLIEVNSETDFVAKNDDFRNFVKDCQKQIVATNPADVDALLNTKFVDGDATIGEMLTEKIATIGENMNIRRFARYEGVVETYIHGGGRIGVIVKFDTTPEIAAKEEFKALAHDVCMQVAAAAPAYLEPSQVPAEVVEKEKEVLTQQALNEGKPAAIVEKMVMGRISKYYKEVCLVEQEFVKDPDTTVKKYVEAQAKAMGGEVKIVEYARFEKGEGLEKREDDFASEVANMVK